ncbi:MAG: hypothetical protein DMF91_11980 [Acidobacteria bacterium]|nr:MAG: hypothetical protein DMF91_11980 [Acidobacteriota bacterium]
MAPRIGSDRTDDSRPSTPDDTIVSARTSRTRRSAPHSGTRRRFARPGIRRGDRPRDRRARRRARRREWRARRRAAGAVEPVDRARCGAGPAGRRHARRAGARIARA